MRMLTPPLIGAIPADRWSQEADDLASAAAAIAFAGADEYAADMSVVNGTWTLLTSIERTTERLGEVATELRRTLNGAVLDRAETLEQLAGELGELARLARADREGWPR